MNSLKISRAMSNIDDDLIERASRTATARRIQPAPLLRILLPAAACLVVVLGFFLWPDSQKLPADEPVGESFGVMLPIIELPDDADTGAYSMIGFFIYQERFYTHSSSFLYGDAEFAISNLVGERIGYAKGNIDEWSKQDEYAVEFAGSIKGDVYTVKGHDPRYRLCVVNGFDMPSVVIYEWFSGYKVSSGHDLYPFYSLLDIKNGEVLSENWSNVQFQTHDDWDNGLPKKHDFTGIRDEEITAFFYDVYFGEFEYVFESVSEDFYYSGLQQAHLFVRMNDGIILELRLFEGGYVGYQPLGWFFVKIPGESFDRIFDACR